jgi:hypothetical protein
MVAESFAHVYPYWPPEGIDKALKVDTASVLE